MMIVVALVASVASADTAKAPSAADAFAKMKSLAGTWNGNTGEAVYTVTYHVTGGGSAVLETLFPGTPHEMMTMYTLNDGNLEATHYCAAGNQPEMRYDPAKSSADKLIFDFVSVRGPKTAGYMHDATLQFAGPDRLNALWSQMNANGTPNGAHEFNLTRVK